MIYFLHSNFLLLKNLTFCDLKVWSGSGWNRISLAPWIQIRIQVVKSWIRIRTETNAVPQHWCPALLSVLYRQCSCGMVTKKRKPQEKMWEIKRGFLPGTVADPGCLSRIPNPKTETIERGEKKKYLLFLPFLYSHILQNWKLFYFWTGKKLLANLQRTK